MNAPMSVARRFHLLRFLGFLMLVPLLSLAQLYTGSVNGVVADPSGAIVPNAQIRLLDEAKGFAFTAVTALLSTQDATTGQTVNRKFINDLPLISRSVTDLAYLTPGITEADAGCQGLQPEQFYFQRRSQRHRRHAAGWRHGDEFRAK
jgi:hypothetical protein